MGKSYHVFCCYTNKDEIFLQNLKKHLMPLQREGLLIVQADKDISPGKERQREIDHYLEVADIILLLISPDFISSDYCFGEEMRQAMARHQQGTACVIPIIIRPVDWQNMPFGKLQSLPKDAKPISLWTNRDEAFLHIAEEIRIVVQELTTNTCADQEKEEPWWPRAKQNPSGESRQERNGMDTSNSSNQVNFNGPVSGKQVIGQVTGGQVIGEQHNTYLDDQKDGIRSLKKGSKALWSGNYPSAKKELHVAVEEIDGDAQPRDASRARYLYTLALLDGKLPRAQGRLVIQSIQELMDYAIRLYPCASYYRIFASIKKNFFEHNGLDHRLHEVAALEREGTSLPRCTDDDENEEYFRRCQPRLQM